LRTKDSFIVSGRVPWCLPPLILAYRYHEDLATGRTHLIITKARSIFLLMVDVSLSTRWRGR
jgi:hypothetical protein